MVRFPGETHELSRSGKPVHRVERLQHIVAWFDKYLQGQEIHTHDVNQRPNATLAAAAETAKIRSAAKTLRIPSLTSLSRPAFRLFRRRRPREVPNLRERK